MKKIAKILAAVLALCLMFSITACGDKGITVQDIKDQGKLLVATNAEFPPFEYKEGDEFVGLDMELSKMLAKELGVEVEISDMAFDNIVTAIKVGQAHIGVAGMTVRPDRLQNVDFSEPYFSANQVIIIKKDSDFTATSELKDMKVGIQDGTTAGDYLRENGKEPMGYESGALAIEALKAGQLDCVVIDNYPAIEFVKMNPELKIFETPLTVEEYAIAVPKNSPEVVEFINNYIKKIKDDGTFDSLLEKYGLK